MAPLSRRRLAAVALAPLGAAAPAHALPVIRRGREQEVLALFAPYALGQEVTPGLSLWNVRVKRERIIVELKGTTPASFRLEHPQRVHSERRSKSFSIVLDGSHAAPAAAAVNALVARVVANDAGGFWDEEGQRPASDWASSGGRWRAVWLPAVVTLGFAAAAVAIARRRART